MSWDHILQATNLTDTVGNWVDEPSTTVWVLTALAGLLWILIRRTICAHFRPRFDANPQEDPMRHPEVGWWPRLRQYLPQWPRRPNLILLVLSPSSSRSNLHQLQPESPENGEEDHKTMSPNSTEVVSFHFESNTSHRRSLRRRLPSVTGTPSSEGVSSNSDRSRLSS